MHAVWHRLLSLMAAAVGLAQPGTVAAAPVSAVVTTTLGRVQGFRRTLRGSQVDVYYGIPFAKPPEGELRFQHPVPADPWSGVRNASVKPNSCLQAVDRNFDRFLGVQMWNPNTDMSEDCLYLNVWVPRGFAQQPPRATMVWIYGGGFWAGTSTLDVYDGSKLAAAENVIVASINYRLGPLGFLYTATPDAPGNQGLLDQVLALKFLYDNVINFGGAQETITIFGESAGAVSVGFHLLSRLSRNYFARAVMQSASPIAEWGVQSSSQATTRARTLAEALGCSGSSAATMVSCLRKQDAMNMTEKQWELTKLYLEMPFGPVVDNYFLPGLPSDLVAKGLIKDTQVILGVNKDEGMFWLLYGFKEFFPLSNSGSLSRKAFENNVLPQLINSGDKNIQDAFLYQYADKLPPDFRDGYRDIADDISGDILFKCPVVDFATAYANLSHSHSVYLYSFEHRLSNNPWPQWTGVLHGYEIEAVFGLPQEANYTAQEEALAARIMGYWTRFAQYGDPNPANNSAEVRWPRLRVEQQQYLRLTAEEEGDSVQHALRYEQCAFRSQILPLLQPVQTTNPLMCHTAGQAARMPLLVTVVLATTFTHLLQLT